MEGECAGGLSRRELIIGGAALGAAITAGAASARADTEPHDLTTLLTQAVHYERLTVVAYDHMAALALLTVRERRLLRALARQDRDHARVLESQCTARGIALPSAPVAAADVDAALSAKGMSGTVAGAGTLKEVVQVLLDIEALAQGGYYLIVRYSPDSALAQSAAQAMASDAQHSVLLTGLVSTKITATVPSWYVTGVT